MARAQDLEGSRFVVSQLYCLAAGGSRERPLACKNPAPHLCSGDDSPIAVNQFASWVIPGSRLLDTDIAAYL
jgi:hypothetical protein